MKVKEYGIGNTVISFFDDYIKEKTEEQKEIIDNTISNLIYNSLYK